MEILINVSIFMLVELVLTLSVGIVEERSVLAFLIFFIFMHQVYYFACCSMMV